METIMLENLINKLKEVSETKSAKGDFKALSKKTTRLIEKLAGLEKNVQLKNLSEEEISKMNDTLSELVQSNELKKTLSDFNKKAKQLNQIKIGPEEINAINTAIRNVANFIEENDEIPPVIAPLSIH